MFKINRKLEYALMVLRHVAAQPKAQLTTAKEICQIYHTPFEVMAKVMQQLAHAEWLAVEYGVKGGYRLNVDLQTLNFLQFAETLLGPVQLIACDLDADAHCELSASCNVVSPLKKLNHKLKEFYQSIRVADLLEAKGHDAHWHEQRIVV